MALPVFDAAKHHIGLGGLGFVLQGQVSENFQRVGGSSEFGSEADLISPVPSLSRWTQDDFSGGGYAREWGRDPAMFAHSAGMLPVPTERAARTVPPMVFFDSGFLDEYAITKLFVQHGAFLFQVTNGPAEFGGFIKQLTIADPVTGELFAQDVGTSGLVDAREMIVAEYDLETSRIYTFDADDADTSYQVREWGLAGALNMFARGVAGKSAGRPKGFTLRGGDFVAQLGHNLWYGKSNEAEDTIKWTQIGRLPGAWKDSVTYNGLIYILCQNGLTSRSTVVAFDGTNILPIVELPYNFVGAAIQAYAGRIYVGGSGWDFAKFRQHAELYEITGGSLRLIRSFNPSVGPTSPGRILQMVVSEGLLFCATQDMDANQGILTYDAITDSLWHSHRVSEAGDYGWISPGRDGGLYVLGSPAVGSDSVYQRATTSLDLVGGVYTSELQTSDFAPESDLDKRWSRLRVRTRGGGELAVSYSLDGGETFTALVVTSTQTGDVWDHDIDLTAVLKAKQIRFKFEITHNEIASSSHLVAFTLQFAFVGGQKRAWLMTAVAVDQPEHADGTKLAYDYATARTQLQAWQTGGDVVAFIDLHGGSYDVVVHDVGVSHPFVGDPNGAGDREGLLALTLLEV